MDTSLDTSQLNNRFFPDVLRGKRIKEDYELWASKELLEEYLKTENPKHLFQAIKKNDKLILQGSGIPETYLRYNNIEYVDAYTIVFVSIGHWQWLHFTNRENEKIVKTAERLLTKIGSSLIPHDIVDYEQINCGNYFVHKKPHWKGSDSSIKYNDANEFINCWDNIDSAFLTKNKRYKKIARPLLEEMREKGIEAIAHAIIAKKRKEEIPKKRDLIKIIKEKLNENISEKELDEFNLADHSTITASYIAWKNEKQCLICKKEAEKRKRKASKYSEKYQVAYKTILNLHNQAVENIKSL